MVKEITKYGLFIIMLLCSRPAYAQHDTFARVKVSPRNGVVKQAYKVTISVYTSTWYTEPLQFSNLQIDNAFIIPFTRTLSSMTYMNGKGYATLTFYYLVFPYETGNMVIPPLDITATTPPEGDYKAVAVKINTRPQTIKVSTIPATPEAPVTMVANDVYLQEKWNKPLDNLKVGDVIERTIHIYASGTLPSLISPFTPETPLNTSLYPRNTELKDQRTTTNAGGLRIEQYAYLFEEEGTITIPKETISWYSPLTKRTYSRSTEAHTLTIAPNPDLAVMQSLKDSLQALNAPVGIQQGKKEIPWNTILITILVSLLFIFAIQQAIKLIVSINKQRKKYLLSEAYYLKQLLAAIHKGQNRLIINQLYRWYDRARKQNHPLTITSLVSNDEKKLLELILSSPNGHIQSKNRRELKQIIKKVSKRLSCHKATLTTSDLNPV